MVFLQGKFQRAVWHHSWLCVVKPGSLPLGETLGSAQHLLTNVLLGPTRRLDSKLRTTSNRVVRKQYSIMIKGMVLGTRQTGVGNLTHLLTSCMSLVSLLNLTKSQFSHNK